MGPSQGNFWRSGLSGRPGRTNASWSCGGRQWLSMLSGIQDSASSVYCEMCALPRDMDLGNYLLACVCPVFLPFLFFFFFFAVFSVQVLMRQMRKRRLKATGIENLSAITLKAGFASDVNKNDFQRVAEYFRSSGFVVSFYFILSAAIVCWRSSLQKLMG